MNTTTRSSTAERLGRWVGRGWRGYVRRERDVAGWLVSRNVPAGVVTVLLWSAKLDVLAVLLYVAFWLALLLVGLLLVARSRGGQYDDFAEPRDELRHGEAGFGWYSQDGHRLDPHDPNDPYDD